MQKPPRKLDRKPDRDRLAKARQATSTLDAIERLLDDLGPDADLDDASLALWEPVRAFNKAAR